VCWLLQYTARNDQRFASLVDGQDCAVAKVAGEGISFQKGSNEGVCVRR